jgi:hypothetical protein
VASVEQSVGTFALPVDTDHHAGTEGSNHASEGVESDSACQSPFDPSDKRLRDVGTCGQIDLTPALPDPDRPDRATDPNEIHHRKMVTKAPHRGVTPALG